MKLIESAASWFCTAKGALQEMPLGCSTGGAIFFSILTVNIVYYGSLLKTLNLTPLELMNNAD